MDRINLGIQNLEAGKERPVEPGARLILRASPGGERAVAISGFVREGLERGEGVVAVLSTSAVDFMSRLESLGVDAWQALEEGQLHIVDWESFHRRSVRGVEEVDGMLLSSVDLANVRMALGMAMESLDASAFQNKRLLLDIIDGALSLYSKEELEEHLLPLFSKIEGATGLVVISEDHKSEDIATSFAHMIDGILVLTSSKRGVQVSLVSLSPKVLDVSEKRTYIGDTGLVAERSGLACVICGTWVLPAEELCSTCGADLTINPPEKILQKVEAGHSHDLFLCPFCGAFISKEATQCEICGVEFVEEEEEEEPGMLLEDMGEELEPVISTVQEGVGEPGRVEALFQRFFGVSAKKAEEVEEEHHNLYLCPHCGAIVSKGTEECPLCRQGIDLDGLTTLAFDDDSALLCSNCGAFLPSGAEICPICDAELDMDVTEEGEAEEWEDMQEVIAVASLEEFFDSARRKKELEEERLGVGERKGLTNGTGLTNGALFQRKGLVNGRGRTNGLTNGSGLVNGRGRTNGLVNGLGLINGNGLVNGNGLIYGDGLVNGNGLIYSDGLVNGFGPRYNYETILRRHTTWKYRAAVIALVFVLMLPSVFIFSFQPSHVHFVGIDGEFSDWAEVNSFWDIAEGSGPDILEIKFIEREENLYMYLRASVDMETTGGLQAFMLVDTDGNASTGYEVHGIGADSILILYILEGNVRVEVCSKFANNESHLDWRGFQQHRVGKAACSGYVVETVISKVGAPAPREGDILQVVLVLENAQSERDVTPILCPGNPGSLALLQTVGGGDVVQRDTSFLLDTIEVYAPGGNVKFSELSCKLLGSAPYEALDQVSLYLDDGNGGYGPEDALLAQATPSSSSFSLPLDHPHEMMVGQLSTMLLMGHISPDAPVSTAVGAWITSIPGLPSILDNNVDIFSLPYIDLPPDRVEIDGGYGDWHAGMLLNDPLEDARGGSDDVDMGTYGLAIDTRGLFLYLDVAGHLLAGRDVPHVMKLSPSHSPSPPPAPAPPRLPDADRDGIDDANDTHPHDFDDDGIEDLEDWDRDNDGVRDYDWGGDDVWLYREDTGVRIYIGSITEATSSPVTGEDAIRIFMDRDSNSSTGYDDPALVGGMESMVEILGRDGKVTSSAIYEYTDDNGTWGWNRSGEVSSALSHHAIEMFIALDPLYVINATVSMVITGWNGTGDMGDQDIRMPQPTRLMKLLSRGAETKTLYIREGGDMNTFMGGLTQTVTLYSKQGQDSVIWTQAPPMAGTFNLSGAISTHLYLAPITAGSNKPSVTVTLGYGATIIGSTTISGLTGENWYTFTTDTLVPNVPAGQAITVTVTVSGTSNSLGATIYFASGTYDSRSVFQTDTYIDVEWVRTHNATAETKEFEPEEVVEIRANITDPLGIQDIKEVRATIYYPNGTLLASDILLLSFSQDPGGYWEIYNNSIALASTTPSGAYLVEIIAVETNDVTSTGSHWFFSPVENGVLFYSDQTHTASAGDSVSYEVFLENIGAYNNSYLLSTSTSSMGWPTNLSYGGNIIARDDEGDGIWDWIDPGFESGNDVRIPLSPGIAAALIVTKAVPMGASGMVDTTSIFAVSENHTGVEDNVALVTVVPSPQVVKALYLNGGDMLTTQMGASLLTTEILAGNDHIWTQSPIMAGPFEITGVVTVDLYISTSTQGNRIADVTVGLYYGAFLLGSSTMNDIATDGWYTFAIPAEGSFTGGDALSLRVFTSERPIIVYYDSATYDSRVEIPTNTYTHVVWAKTYNSSAETMELVVGETNIIRAQVSDPLGQQDIQGAVVTITYPNGTTLVSEPMIEETPDPGNYWKLFNYTFTLPWNSPVGEYVYTVNATETDGATHSLTTKFIVRCNVTVGPNNTALTLSGATVTYTHWINNTGKGSDTYNLFVTSSQGWNVSIMDGGAVMAYDSNGDGNWDYVNPAYDTDGDGEPDTGRIHMGASFPITVTIVVPSGAIGTDVTYLSVINTKGTCSASATDTTVSYIPLLSAEWLILLCLPAFLLYGRHPKRRHRAKAKKAYIADPPDIEIVESERPQ